MKRERIKKVVYTIILAIACFGICSLFILMLVLEYKFNTKDESVTKVEDISYIGTIKVISEEKVVIVTIRK